MDETVNRTQPARSAPGSVYSKPPPRRGGGLVGLLLLVLLVVAGYFVYERIHSLQTAGRGGFHVPPQSVRTAAATTGDMPIILSALGTVMPLDSVNVQTQIAGQLQKVGFTEGQMVKAGGFLALIDPRPFQAALEQAQATFQKDTASLAQARADLARFVLLAKQDSIAAQQVEDQQFLVKQDQAAVAVDQANIDTAKLNLAYCTIDSPIAGLAGLLQVNVGNYLQPSAAAAIVTVTQLQPIAVVFAIPQQDLPQVRARMLSGAKLQVTALDQTDSHAVATGVLMATDSQISTTTGTVNLKASFANTDDALFPNQFVNVQLLVDTDKGAVLVPNPAIQRGAPGTFVYLVNSNHTVSVQKVQIGPSDATNTVIKSGLSPGQNVVIDGADRLSDGAKVVVRNNSPTAAAGNAAEGAAAAGAQGARRGKGGRRRKSGNSGASGAAGASAPGGGASGGGGAQ
jgi:membrane fusion protein, multidrug efflux system